ncbi:hypothetical protein FQA39_LY02069 [Lamprigera yunnana]|nr:hypothetical protein FQA39_LY02069 [Lamprigera yunnana]
MTSQASIAIQSTNRYVEFKNTPVYNCKISKAPMEKISSEATKMSSQAKSLKSVKEKNVKTRKQSRVQSILLPEHCSVSEESIVVQPASADHAESIVFCEDPEIQEAMRVLDFQLENNGPGNYDTAKHSEQTTTETNG